MKPFRPTTLLLSITLSSSFVFSGRSQQASPKPKIPTGDVQTPSKRQTPAVPAPSKEKKAQKGASQPADEEGATQKIENKPNLEELRQRGIDLAQQVGEEATGIDDLRSAAIIQAVAADVLWPHRKELARDMFLRAFETAVTHYKETLDDNWQQIGKQGRTLRGDVRVEVIKLINKRDPKMGAECNEKFIESKSREEQERSVRAAASGQGQGAGDSRFFGGNFGATNGLIEAANTLLSEDAKMAAGVARRAADLSVSPAFVMFISAFSRRDRAAADLLYLHALELLNAAQTPLPGQLLALSAYPFGEGQIRVSDGKNNSGWGFGKPANFNVNTQHAQKFLTVALNALQRLADPSLTQLPDAASRLSIALYTAKALESKVAAFHPALQDQWQEITSRLEALNPVGSGQKFLQQIERDARQREAEDRARDESSQNRSNNQQKQAEDLLERAQKTNDFAQRDGLYSQAALAAENAGDISRALEIAGRISDMTFKEKMKSWINFNASEKAIKEKRYGEARQYALGVDETDFRAFLFFQIAEKMLSDNDRDRAAEALEEAARRAVEADDTQEKIRALCGVADIYLKIDQTRSFSLAEAAVRAANKVPADKLSLIEGGSRMIRILSNAGSSRTNTQDVGGFDLRKVFGRLAGYDFDRSLGLAQAIENKSIRCWTMIAVAESAFVKREAPGKTGKN